MLPTEPSLFTDGWQTKLGELFPNVSSKPISRTSQPGSMTTMMVQVLDQAESEIFFPIVNVKNQTTNEIKPQVAVFRERLDDEGMVFDFIFFNFLDFKNLWKKNAKS